MKSILRFSAVLSLVASLALCFDANAFGAENAKISHVVMIGVDGGGNFFRQADTPNLDKIFENGAISYDVLTSKPTISAECWGSMLHGVTPEVHGLTNSIVSSRPFPVDGEFPSVFRVIRENMPDAKLASFCNWNPINFGIIEDNLGVEKGTAGNDEAVTDLTCKYLADNVPTFLFVQFDNVDGAGHGNGYGTQKHLDQITKSDGYIQRIYEACAKNGMLDSTLFIVDADHGGNGKGHGGWTDGEKLIMFAAAGPGVEKGTIGEMAVRDSSSVVLYALGLIDKQPETWTSRVPSGLFKGVVAKERPVYTIKYAYEHRTHKTIPTPNDDNSPIAALGKDRVSAYFPFDSDVKDALGKVKTKDSGKLYFVDGYFGQGVKFDDGFVSIANYKPEKKSFSAAFWFKTSGIDGDPAIFSNKNWKNGGLPGYILSLRGADVKFNVGNGGKRADFDYPLPRDFRDGWVHVVFVVDREANEIRFAYDFGDFIVKELPNELKDVNFTAGTTLNIGQDGTGTYPAKLGAELDELIFVDGVLTSEDVAKLKSVYQAK